MANCAAYSDHILWRDWKFAARPYCRLSWRPPCPSDKDCLDSENPASRAAAVVGKCDLGAKKKERREAPPSGQPISRLPACQFALPESIRALWGRTPTHGKFYRGHARYACRRTPRQTSGLSAGAELSLESKDIIASTNPECPDTFENNRTTQLHRCTATELQSYMATHREEYDDYFAVQTFGAITPGAL